MEDITITGLERLLEPKMNRRGHTVLAYFTADVGVFRLHGCLLVRTAKSGLAAWLPNLDDPQARRRRSITLLDEATRNALMQAAREMYIRMGGTDADWRPRDDAAEAWDFTDQPDARDIPAEPERRMIGVKRTITRIAADD